MSDSKYRGFLGSSECGKSGFDALMDEVCVSLGYCGCLKDGRPLHVDMLIPPDGPVTADQFVEWVFLADNLNPNLQPDAHRRALKAAFVRHMGGEVADATLLRWRYLDDQPD